MSQRRRIPSVGLFLLALMTCLLTCSLVGCTGRDPGKKIILEVYYDAPLHISDYYLSVFRKFERDYPYIRIKSERGVANYYAKLQTRMASGTAPDVMYIQNKSLADYRDRGVLLNLKAFINKEKYDLDDIYELGLIEGGISEEQVYGIPVTGAPEVLIYNKRLFDEFSLSYPDERWSWDDLLAASIKLTRDTNGDGRIDQFGISIVPGWWAQDIAWIWSNGGEVFNDKLNKCVVDNRQAGEAIQFLADLTGKYRVTPKKLLDAKQNSVADLFMGGNLGMFVGLPYVALTEFSKVKNLDWDIAPVPKSRLGKRVVRYTGECWTISSKTGHPKEAWLLLKRLCSKEVARELAKRNMIPARISVLKSPDFIKPDTVCREEVVVESLKFARAVPSLRNVEELGSIWKNQIEATVLEKDDVSSALKNIEREFNTVLFKKHAGD